MKGYTVMTDYILTYEVVECTTCGNEVRTNHATRSINDVHEIKESGATEFDSISMPDVEWYDDVQGKEVCAACYTNS